MNNTCSIATYTPRLPSYIFIIISPFLLMFILPRFKLHVILTLIRGDCSVGLKELGEPAKAFNQKGRECYLSGSETCAQYYYKITCLEYCMRACRLSDCWNDYRSGFI